MALLGEIASRNPSAHRLRDPGGTQDKAPVKVADLHRAILAAFDTDKHYLFQWEACNLAASVSGNSIHARWAAQVAEALCRNAIVMIGDYANTYMARGAMETDKSEDTLLWLETHRDEVARFAQTQGDAFAAWADVTLKNTLAWIKAGKPLCNPTSEEQRAWHDVRQVEEGIWCGYYQYCDMTAF